ncbi:alpha/beta hydrolase [Acaryochloris sp. IP29b_bin.148]|uniref:alpha/beta fold hydrolase n=1 Tax=Acaryochloris sp. IP29b_bin.148 TaxID=2969218 RepID=UPI00262F47F0|nr:alpha/beta hydrolase [Acaryochloris sp. IP29b_bin.148]
MSTSDALWLCVNPRLKRLDWNLCQHLKQHANVKFWSYHQTADEPCSIQTALSLLHHYIQLKSDPIHLLGHGLSGALGLLYARQNPQAIRSLTLLSVGANPSIGWHAHYYKMRDLLPCSREAILFQMATMLFGPMGNDQTIELASLLATILDTELAPHSLAHQNGLPSGGVEPPLLVCHGEYDAVIDPYTHARWQPYLKPGDRLWSCPQGRHFFHHDHSHRTSQIVLAFWQQVSSMPSVSLSSAHQQQLMTLLCEEMNHSALLSGD